MKVLIDTENKILKLEDSVNLGEFIEKIKVMLPNWKEFKIETNTVINWSSPYIPYQAPWWSYSGYGDIAIQCGNVGAVSGTYCIEL